MTRAQFKKKIQDEIIAWKQLAAECRIREGQQWKQSAREAEARSLEAERILRWWNEQ